MNSSLKCLGLQPNLFLKELANLLSVSYPADSDTALMLFCPRRIAPADLSIL
jgi:hypothetical protein